MNHYRLTWLGIQIALVSGAVWLAVQHLRRKPPPARNRTPHRPQPLGILGVYIDESDRFVLSLATSRFDTSLLAKGRLAHHGNGSVVVDAWDSSSIESPIRLWNLIRQSDEESNVTQTLEVLFAFARATIPTAMSHSALYSSLILPIDLSFTQRERVLSLATSAGRFRRTFGLHLHDLLRPLEGPCKPEYGNHPSLVFNPNGSSFLVSHSIKGCLHVRTDDRDPSSSPLARLSLYSNTTLEDIISIDYTPLSEITPTHNPTITPPVRSLSLDTIVQRAPIISGYTAAHYTAGNVDRELEDDLQAFARWHIPLNRDPVLVSLPIPPTTNSPDPYRFLEDWQKGSHTKFTTSPGQTAVELDFYTVPRLRESWPPIPGSSTLFASVALDGLPLEGGSEVLIWFDGHDVQVVNPDTGRRAKTPVGTLRFDEVLWRCGRPSSSVG
ncbi:hypothetical protein FA13DRAFT_1816967 [Coprinellus micaceus]|uniref:Uncharacterized protein n=1 Tax=Coprinellus micaceus TaxID=71717 RepID=A0A4Y7SX89_COPMI|nr:hypothetical protein FA13DRAFT_1816967 [Coprinellus micaceus]